MWHIQYKTEEARLKAFQASFNQNRQFKKMMQQLGLSQAITASLMDVSVYRLKKWLNLEEAMTPFQVQCLKMSLDLKS